MIYLCTFLGLVNFSLCIILYRFHLRIKRNHETITMTAATMLTVSQATTDMSDAVKINLESLANSFKITVDDYGVFKADVNNFVELVVNYMKEVKAQKGAARTPVVTKKSNLN